MLPMLMWFTCGAGVFSFFWQHFSHLKLGSDLWQPFMFEQRGWIQLLQWWQNIELLPTPLHTPHGYLLGRPGHSAGGLLRSILILDMLTCSRFALNLSLKL